MSDSAKLDEAQLANAIVGKMLPADSFSRWLGVESLEIAPGRSVIRMTVREDMLNGYRLSHAQAALSGGLLARNPIYVLKRL